MTEASAATHITSAMSSKKLCVTKDITVLDSAARPPARTGGSLGEEFGWTRKSKGRLKRGRPLSHRSLMSTCYAVLRRFVSVPRHSNDVTTIRLTGTAAHQVHNDRHVRRYPAPRAANPLTSSGRRRRADRHERSKGIRRKRRRGGSTWRTRSWS